MLIVHNILHAVDDSCQRILFDIEPAEIAVAGDAFPFPGEVISNFFQQFPLLGQLNGILAVVFALAIAITQVVLPPPPTRLIIGARVSMLFFSSFS